jgi:predicted nucleic acid-binding protein
VLIDINVILDVLLEREPHFKSSRALWMAIENGAAEGLLAAHAFATIHYLAARKLGDVEATRTIASLLRTFGVAPIDTAVLRAAVDLSSGDYEDAVIAASAHAAGCDLLVTRDLKGFRKSLVRVVSPQAATAIVTRS